MAFKIPLFAAISGVILCAFWLHGTLASPSREKRYASLLFLQQEGTKVISDPGNCVSDCVESEYMSLKINPDNRQDCKIERDFIRCLEACPQSQLRDTIFTSRTVGKMICMDDYEDFKKHRACIELTVLNENPNATFQECPENGNEKVMDFVADPFTANGLHYESNGAAVQANLTKICLNYQCNVQSNQDALRNSCGKAASDLWVKFLKSRVKSAMDVHLALRVLNATVPECDSLLNS